MNLIRLSHKVLSFRTDEDIVDSFLLQRDLLDHLRDTIQLSGTTHKNKSSLDAELLASKWNTSIKNARHTIDVMTQKHVRLLASKNVYHRFKTLTSQRQ